MMKLQKLFYVILLLFAAGFGCNVQKKWDLMTKAKEAEDNKDWYVAEQYYAKLIKLDSSNKKFKYAYAEVCRKNFDTELAIKYYKKLIAVDRGVKYPLCYYYLGQLYKNKQQYPEAKTWFVKFNKLNLKPEAYNYFILKGKIEEVACDTADYMVKHPIKISGEHLPEPINSKVSEYAPFEKDSVLYFSSLRPISKNESNEAAFGKIYRVDVKSMKLLKVKQLDTNYNKPHYHDANTCFSPDNKQMIISRCTAKNASDYACALYSSRLVNNKWLAPEAMPSPINLPGVSTSQPNYAILDGKTVLFFSSDRPGGEGGMDIWYSQLKADGSFDTPVNAGKSINTPDDEITPWYVGKKNTLYFSSTYHAGLGGFDVFRSTFRDGAFGKAVNAGFPVNSSYNDIYFSENNTAKQIYVSSNRVGSLFEGKLNCCNDLYRFNIDTIKAVVVPTVAPLPPPPQVKDTVVVYKEQMKLLVPLTLYFHNDEPNPKSKDTVTSKNYETTYNEFKNLLPAYATAYSKGLRGDLGREAVNEITSFFTDSLETGLNNLKRFSNMLQKVLLNGETVRITFKGYCSPLASSDYNIRLAKRRVCSVRNYFMETNNGWFVKYINNSKQGEGKIIFEEVAVGELLMSKASDDLRDKRNSVYSPNAAADRKIQVLAVSFEK